MSYDPIQPALSPVASTPVDLTMSPPRRMYLLPRRRSFSTSRRCSPLGPLACCCCSRSSRWASAPTRRLAVCIPIHQLEATALVGYMRAGRVP